MAAVTHDDSDVFDTEFLAVNAFKEEGAFLLQAGLASAALNQRIAAAHPSVQRFLVSRGELEAWAYQLTRAVAIASEFHVDASEAMP